MVPYVTYDYHYHSHFAPLGFCSNLVYIVNASVLPPNFQKWHIEKFWVKLNFFGKFYADTFYDCQSDIYTSVSENDSSREYCSDSDKVNIRATKSQETLVIDSDTKSANETHGAGEDLTGVSGVTIECNNLQSVSEITELIYGWTK